MARAHRLALAGPFAVSPIADAQRWTLDDSVRQHIDNVFDGAVHGLNFVRQRGRVVGLEVEAGRVMGIVFERERESL